MYSATGLGTRSPIGSPFAIARRSALAEMSGVGRAHRIVVLGSRPALDSAAASGGREQARGIPTQDQEQVVAGMRAAQLLQSVHRVGRPVAPGLHVRDLEAALTRNRKPAHLEPLLGAGDRAFSPMRRAAGRNEQDAVELRAIERGPRGGDVSEMDRVEGAAQDADPHGWYSNSTPAMVTVSPAFTPAASSAALTPMRSSCA